MAEIKDIYLETPPRQPKKDIADHLEKMGILAPRRFETLEQGLVAIRQGCEVIIRSEHPQDYAGVSDIMDSRIVTQADLQEIDSLRRGLSQVRYKPISSILAKSLSKELDESQFAIELAKLDAKNIRIYCKLMGIEPDDFYKDVSFSHWERLSGYNRSIVADSSIDGRYHLFTDHPEGYYSNYSVIDQGEIVFSEGEIFHEELRGKISEVIEFYECIRSVEGFDPNHCPLVEFQTLKDLNYFLQYHRTRNFSPSEWVLERNPEPGEKEVQLVRGATPPDGLILNVTLDYGNIFVPMETEDASFDAHYNFVFADIMSRRRKVNFDRFLNISPTKRHSFKSRAFKSEIYVSIGSSEIPHAILERGDKNLISAAELTPRTTPIRLVSDGRRAFVKFLDV